MVFASPTPMPTVLVRDPETGELYTEGGLDLGLKMIGSGLDSPVLTTPTFLGLKIDSIAAPAAAGTTQATATVLAADLEMVTGANGTAGVALPAAASGKSLLVVNTDPTNALLVYPVNGGNDQINALAANAAFTLAPGQAAVFSASSATQWYAAPAAANLVHLDAGKFAGGLVDFNLTGDCTALVVGAVTYTVSGAPVVTNGEWAVGASAAASATNLAAGINGDTRNAGGPSYVAVVGASTTTVWIFALTAGTAGNVTVSRTGGVNPDAVENLVGGAAAAVRKTIIMAHTVTTEEGVQVAVEIPLPFTPGTNAWTIQVRASTGALKTTVTDTFALAAAPDRIVSATAGAVHLVAGDVVIVHASQ